MKDKHNMLHDDIPTILLNKPPCPLPPPPSDRNQFGRFTLRVLN